VLTFSQKIKNKKDEKDEKKKKKNFYKKRFKFKSSLRKKKVESLRWIEMAVLKL